MNNINILTYERFTENNCKQFKKIHEKCLIIIKKYKTLFTSEKYILIHFSRKKQFNMKTFI